MENNKLEIIVRESGLEQTKAKVLLDKFTDYFNIAAEWEIKAKNIVVTDESQQVDMQMAKVGRKFLQDKRILIEKTRKELKEQSLREGKAIDGIANILKALIVPIEEYLSNQEKFVENKEKERLEQERLEAEKKLEEERIAIEKAEIEEQERIRKENEKLRAEAIENEKKINEEKNKQEEIRKNAEEKQKIAEEKVDNERIEKERLQEKLKDQIECPFCHKTFQLKEGV